MKKLFGTDGIRGVSNVQITPELSLKVGKAIAYVLAPRGGKVLIGKDTRLSSDFIECALASGLASCGVNVILLGVIPTPGVAFLTKNSSANAGIMISASHNSFEFNGIKVFDHNGYKISIELQEKIENLIFSDFYEVKDIPHDKVGIIKAEKYYISKYVSHLRKCIKELNLKVLFDCANGASCNCASKIFRNLFHCDFINNYPNGININDKCGSTDLSSLSHEVVSNRFDLGVAYDGDADRCLAIDENGEVIDGDHILASLAVYMKKNSILLNNSVVSTVMSNMSLSDFLDKQEIKLIQTQVGDQFVSEEMRKSNSSLGGEQSGHIILSNYSTTGDGILTSIMLINIVSEMGKASNINKMFKRYPQIVKNIKFKKDNDFTQTANFKSTISEVKEKLSDSGRILVRKSGTEPIVRIMIEAKELKLLKEAEEMISIFDK